MSSVSDIKRNTNPLTFMVVEDNDLDFEKIERGFRRLKIKNDIVHAIDGVEALEYLRGENGRDFVPSPFVILLDLNLPRMNGFELLKEIRSDSKLEKLNVVVMTTSDHSRDIQRAYDYHVAGYLTKPIDLEGMTRALDCIGAYWTMCIHPDS